MNNSLLKNFVRTVLTTGSEDGTSRDSALPDLGGVLAELKEVGRDWLNRNLLWFMNVYPPYLGAGIRIDDYDPNFRSIRVRMDLNWWNQNYVGTQFGGSLYSMCDPFYMLMLLNNLDSDYEVWDKSASIRFRKPARGTVYVEFEIDDERLDQIRDEVAREGVSEPVFTVDVVDEDGQHVAEVEKKLHVSIRGDE